MLNCRSPNTNAYMERFIQTVQQECMDKFIVFGREHLDHVFAEYAEHYHQDRPHQGKGNMPLTEGPDVETPAGGEVLCRERLGRVLRHYYRQAA